MPPHDTVTYDLRALGYFVAAYEEKSVTAAARRCFIAQPSISAAIRNLEAALGLPLFERTRTGLVPTLGGERLYPRARGLLAESKALLREFRAAPKTELALYVQDDVLTRRLAPLIDALAELAPDAVLRITRERQDASLRVVAEHCKDAREWFVPLWQEEYVVILPYGHPLRSREGFELRDLHGMAFIERPFCALNLVFTRMLAESGIVPDVRASAQREEVLLQLVELGLGAALVPASHAVGLRNVLVRPLQAPAGMSRRLGLACPAADTVAVALVGQLVARLAPAA